MSDKQESSLSISDFLTDFIHFIEELNFYKKTNEKGYLKTKNLGYVFIS